MRLAHLIAHAFVGMLLVLVTPTISASAASPDPKVEDNGEGSFTGSTQVDYKDTRGSARERSHKPQKQSTQSTRQGKETGQAPADTSSQTTLGTSHNLDRDDVERYVRQLIVQLQLPKPTPQFGPDPSVNEWKMAAVGYPIWLWTEGPTTVTSTESGSGYTFTLRAVYQSTTFDMGDGHTKRCTRTTPYRISTKPGAASPTCGYTYLKAARNGSYTVTATTHWDVHWSVAGLSGTLPGTHSDSRDLPVGELQAIVVG